MHPPKQPFDSNEEKEHSPDGEVFHSKKLSYELLVPGGTNGPADYDDDRP